MEWNFDFHERRDFIHVALSGSFDKKDFATMMDDLGTQEYFRFAGRILFDDTALALERMSSSDLLSASDEMINRNSTIGLSKVAILSKPEAFDILEKFELITRYGSKAVIEIFDEEKAALSWLLNYAAFA